MEWACRYDWAEEWSYVLAEHLVPVCDELGIEPQGLESTLGSDGFGIIFDCAPEDLPQLRTRGSQRRR